jgi:hypothetical protein
VIRRLFAPGRHLPLLLALLALFVLYPVMLEVGRMRLMRFGFLVVLAFAVYGLIDRKRSALWGFGLAAPAVVTQMIAYYNLNKATALAATVFGLVFLSFVAATVLASVLKSGRITSDKIAGAIAVYLLLGLAWALAYGSVGIVDPEAFRGFSLENASGPGSGYEYGFIYYSFVTLTTLGYGELVPLSPIARTLAWMQAVTGQLFLAILIARLVGLHIIHSSGDEN